MTYLVDSDWVIDYLDNRPVAVALLNRLRVDGLAMSAATFAEVYEGIFFGRNPESAERVYRQFLRRVQVLHTNRGILRSFAVVRGNLRRTRNLIGDMDILIAATALHHDLTLVTRNVRHFQRVDGLKIYQA